MMNDIASRPIIPSHLSKDVQMIKGKWSGKAYDSNWDMWHDRL